MELHFRSWSYSSVRVSAFWYPEREQGGKYRHYCLIRFAMTVMLWVVSIKSAGITFKRLNANWQHAGLSKQMDALLDGLCALTCAVVDTKRISSLSFFYIYRKKKKQYVILFVTESHNLGCPLLTIRSISISSHRWLFLALRNLRKWPR